MICISIMQESRKLALADMLNASSQCDLLELRLDRFEKSVDLRDFMAKKPKPLIISCRRVKDGGHWDGSESERLALLRQAIIDKADYVEIEIDAADEVRPFPGSKRVISYTNLAETPENIDDIYEQCLHKSPEVIKLVCKASAPEEAWPLLQIVARAKVPTVVVGVGKPGIMLTLLGKRVGAPWTYAALEKGMETYPGQPTVSDLRDIYHYPTLGKGIRFIGVTGFTPRERATCAALNAGLAAAEAPARCLPLAVGDVDFFRKIMDAVKLTGLIVDPTWQVALASLARQRERLADRAGAVDVLLQTEQKEWHGHYVLGRSALSALEDSLRQKQPVELPLTGRMCLILGTNGPARSMAYAIRKRGGVAILAGKDREQAQQLAQDYQCRFVPYEAIYSTSHDVLIVCENEEPPSAPRTAKKPGDAGVHPSILKSSTPLLDLTSYPQPSALADEARARGVPLVEPRAVFLAQMATILRLLCGKEATTETLQAAMALALGEE